MDAGALQRHLVTWEWNAEADEVIASPSLRDVYGVDRLTNVSQGFSLVHPDDAEAHHQEVLQAVERNRGYRSQFRIIRPGTRNVVSIDERAEAISRGPNMHPLLIGFAIRIVPDGQQDLPREALSELARRFDELLTTFARELRHDSNRAAAWQPGEWIEWASNKLDSGH